MQRVIDLEPHDRFVENMTRVLMPIMEQCLDLQAGLRAEMYAKGMTNAYTWSLEELQTIANTPASECPPGEESTWLKMYDMATRELGVRVAYGHLEGHPLNTMVKVQHRIRQRFGTMQRVTRLRGFDVYGITLLANT
jgi:hypothetical protein